MVIKTLEDIKNSNLFGDDYEKFSAMAKIYNDILNENRDYFENHNLDITDIPISPMLLEDDLTPIILSETVVNEYEKLLKLINAKDTAQEYSFILLGKKAKISADECYLVDKIINCDKDEALEVRQTKVDNDKINEALKYANLNNYDFISIGHTHPHIEKEEQDISVANFLSDDFKKEFLIRNVGLNISLQDFVVYDSLYKFYTNNRNIKTSQAIIMYNGEIVIYGKSEGKIKRFVVILDAKRGLPLPVSSKEEFEIQPSL